MQNKYITGMSALNIGGADWHLTGVIQADSWPVSGIDYSDTAELFGQLGLRDCTKFFKSIGKNMESVNCASPARALADMIYHNVFVLKHYPDHIIFRDYLLSDSDINEFSKYFEILKNHAGKAEEDMLLRWHDELFAD
ncbi:MAG TPA: hypothetical protein ENI54_05315 [bacterium]|nr:hypothetical protein [bacterium]